MNQDFVDTAASWSPRVLIDLIGHLGPQLDEVWAARDLDRPGMSVGWAAPAGTAVHIRVTGPGGGDWAARREDGFWALDRGPAAGLPGTRVGISADGLWRVATRNITVDAALRQATITGDRALGAAVLSLVSIIR